MSIVSDPRIESRIQPSKVPSETFGNTNTNPPQSPLNGSSKQVGTDDLVQDCTEAHHLSKIL
jgi:hypothetical protein